MHMVISIDCLRLLFTQLVLLMGPDAPHILPRLQFVSNICYWIGLLSEQMTLCLVGSVLFTRGSLMVWLAREMSLVDGKQMLRATATRAKGKQVHKRQMATSIVWSRRRENEGNLREFQTHSGVLSDPKPKSFVNRGERTSERNLVFATREEPILVSKQSHLQFSYKCFSLFLGGGHLMVLRISGNPSKNLNFGKRRKKS